jgi:hypothetical protein
MGKIDRACENCFYGCDDPDPLGGPTLPDSVECRADLPQLYGQSLFAKWKVVHKRKWCGNFISKEEGEAVLHERYKQRMQED